MDGLAQLLNEFAQTRFHRYLHLRRPSESNIGRNAGFIYLTSIRILRQLQRAMKPQEIRTLKIAATIITE
jgi:hypothetical protein